MHLPCLFYIHHDHLFYYCFVFGLWGFIIAVVWYVAVFTFIYRGIVIFGIMIIIFKHAVAAVVVLMIDDLFKFTANIIIIII